MSKTKWAREYYAAVYEALSLLREDGYTRGVFAADDGGDYHTSTTGVAIDGYWECCGNIALGDFLPDGDLPSEAEFVAMCIECLGTDVPGMPGNSE